MKGNHVSIRRDICAKFQAECDRRGVSMASQLEHLLGDITGEAVAPRPSVKRRPSKPWKADSWTPRVTVSAATLDKLKHEAARRNRLGNRRSNSRRITAGSVLDEMINKAIDAEERKS